MARYVQQKRNLQRAVYLWGGLLVLLIIIFFLARATYGVYQKSRIAAEDRLAHKQELAGLEKRKVSLEAQLAKLQTNRGLEEELRNRYQVGRPGEEAVVIINDDGTATITPLAEATSSPSWWKKVFGN